MKTVHPYSAADPEDSVSVFVAILENGFNIQHETIVWTIF